MKIVYCYDCLSQIGGRECVLATQAEALASIPGNTVWIIYTDKPKSQPFLLPKRVRLMDLDIGYFHHEWKNPWNLIRLYFKRLQHKKRLAVALRGIRPDVVLSFGGFEEKIIPAIPGQWLRVAQIHQVKGHYARSSPPGWKRLLALFSEWCDTHFIYKRYHGLVVLTEADKRENWTSFDSVFVIPNGLRDYPMTVSSLNEPTVIAVGRLAYEKNYPSMIRAFKQVSIQHPEWTLSIVGEGNERTHLEEEIQKNHLENNVILKGQSDNVLSLMLNASLLVVTSLYESFSMVILEAMSCGLPVVSYDCPFGPQSIITNGVDGFLVPQGNETALAETINLLIQSPPLRMRIGKAGRETALRYKADVIARKWMVLFESLMNR